MNFFILGDSWGVGQWQKSNGKFEPVPNTGLDYHLTQAGHTVTNIAQGSAGNFGQLRHAYWTLQENSNYDYMIWFQTESIRDVQEIILDDPTEAQQYFPDFQPLHLDYITYQNYAYAEKLYQQYKIPFFIIGGQSPVRTDLLAEFTFAQHTVESWLGELLELTVLPPENVFFSWPKLEHLLEHFEINKLQYINTHQQELEHSNTIIELATHSELFPDNAHPSSECYQALARKILLLC